MRMIPSEITLGTPSDAERTLFKLLAKTDLGGDEVCLHSLELAENRYQKLGEVDFMIVGPQGLLVLEVKGGRVARDSGVWVYQNRWGRQRRENRGPFKQAENNMWSLLDRLGQLLNIDFKRRHVAGFGVAIPDHDWAIESVEWSNTWVLDHNRLIRRGGLRSYLTELYSYWRGKAPPNVSSITAPIQDRIIKALRPDFDLVPTLGKLGERIDSTLTELTQNQYEKLDFVETVPRVLVTGGAGSGKTMIACHVARRESVAGKRVLLVCHSPMLATYLTAELAPFQVEVRSLAGQVNIPTCDVLVVDEGQDLINFDTIDRLDTALEGGIEHGRWRIFLDPNNQANLAGKFDPLALDILASYSFGPAVLRENCRNTSNIADEVRLLTGADTGVSTFGIGPEVELHLFATPGEAASMLARHLDRLLAEDVAPEQIAILSPVPYLDSSAARLPNRLRGLVHDLTAATLLNPPRGRAIFARIADFKGLERQFVAVTDLIAIDSTPADLAITYVGLTRGRAGLWIGCHEATGDRIKELIEKNQPLVDAGRVDR